MLSDHSLSVLGSILRLQLTFNTGAAFSFATSKTIFLSSLSILVALSIFVFVTKVDNFRWATYLGLVSGGIMGNLADRIFRSPGALQGAVIDWIKISHWPTFNLADSAIVVGVLGVSYLRFTNLNYKSDGKF